MSTSNPFMAYAESVSRPECVKHTNPMNTALLKEMKQMTRKGMNCSKLILLHVLFTLLRHGKDGRFFRWLSLQTPWRDHVSNDFQWKNNNQPWKA